MSALGLILSLVIGTYCLVVGVLVIGSRGMADAILELPGDGDDPAALAAEGGRLWGEDFSVGIGAELVASYE